MRTSPAPRGKAVVHVRVDLAALSAKIPRNVSVQFEFPLQEIPVDNLVNNLRAKTVSFVDAVDAIPSSHVIRRKFKALCTNGGQRPHVDGECAACVAGIPAEKRQRRSA